MSNATMVGEKQAEAKGGVKFELVGIPDVMKEEQEQKKIKNEGSLGEVLVFDMGNNNSEVKPFGKKPVLSSEKKA